MTEPTTPTPGSAGGAGRPGAPQDGSLRRSFAERVVGALKLDAGVYEEVEADPGALGQAAGVVVLAAIASALGSPAAHGGGSFVGGVVGSLIGWLLGTGVIWLIGVVAMKCTSDYPELLRTLGFASAPGLVMIAGVIPFLSYPASAVAWVWGLAAYVVAVRQALDVSTGRAVLVCVLAFGVTILATLLLALLAHA
jgi:hypothetical protein